MKTCVVDGCSRPLSGRKHYCEAHYYRLRRRGSVGVAQIKRHERHGMVRSAEYRIWTNMWTRCTRKNNRGYKYYGARGISVCDRWKSFTYFIADMGKRPGQEFSIDRTDNNGNYEPSNCKWATRSQQNKNRRRFHCHNAKTREERRTASQNQTSGVSLGGRFDDRQENDPHQRTNAEIDCRANMEENNQLKQVLCNKAGAK